MSDYTVIACECGTEAAVPDPRWGIVHEEDGSHTLELAPFEEPSA